MSNQFGVTDCRMVLQRIFESRIGAPAHCTGNAADSPFPHENAIAFAVVPRGIMAAPKAIGRFPGNVASRITFLRVALNR
jgi:hypothetical protein